MAELQAMMAAASPELRDMLAKAEGKLETPQRRYRMNSIDSCSSEEPEARAVGTSGAAADPPKALAAVSRLDATLARGPGEGPVEELPLPEQTLLHEMVAIDRLDKITRQLAKGASVNAPDCMGETPLFWAFSAEVVDLLIREGADVHWRNWLSGCSAFYKFACQGKSQPLRALGKHLRKAGLLDEYINDPASLTRRTPLHAAAGNGFVETVSELLQMQADPALEDYQGKTALELARARGLDTVIALLS